MPVAWDGYVGYEVVVATHDIDLLVVAAVVMVVLPFVVGLPSWSLLVPLVPMTRD